MAEPTAQESAAEQALSVGFLMFPGITQLDLTGPLEVFSRVPNVQIELIAKSMAPVADDHGLLKLRPTATFHTCPAIDIFVVPGGPGQIAIMDDTSTIDFVYQAGQHAKVVCSVCSGSLILAAAGLLYGYRATCHWSSIDQLSILGAIPITQRVVIDRNRVTGAGVTAGIDLALTVVAKMYGANLAEEIQLAMEYDPDPPWRSGSPATASPDVLAKVRARSFEFLSERRNASRRAKARIDRYL